MGAIFETEARKAARKARVVAEREHVPADAQEALVEVAALLERYAKKEEAERQLATSQYQQSLNNVQSSYWAQRSSRPVTHYYHQLGRPSQSLAASLLGPLLWP